MSTERDNLSPDEARRLELAALPRTDPRRQEHLLSLAGDPQARAACEKVFAEADLLRAHLAATPVPGDLESRLMAIAATPRRPAFFALPSASRLAVALVLLCAAVVLRLLWPHPELPAQLTDAVARPAALLACTIHQAPPPLKITSSNIHDVESALKTDSTNMPFPISVLTPREKVTLVGGGLCNFGSHQAVFTRWQNATGLVCTLYQFDGKDFHIPPTFVRTQLNLPAPPGHDPYRVVLWPSPDGVCTWAVVLENSKSPDAFSAVY